MTDAEKLKQIKEIVENASDQSHSVYYVSAIGQILILLTEKE